MYSRPRFWKALCNGLSYQRYLAIKKMSPAERKKVNKRVVFFAGKAAPACELAPIFMYAA
jgi:glucan phosphorylase